MTNTITKKTNASIARKKLELCEEIGNTFGTFYVDVSGIYTIDSLGQEYTYNSTDELLEDWLPKLIAEDEDQQDDYWSETIDFIRDYVL